MEQVELHNMSPTNHELMASKMNWKKEKYIK